MGKRKQDRRSIIEAQKRSVSELNRKTLNQRPRGGAHPDKRKEASRRACRDWRE